MATAGKNLWYFPLLLLLAWEGWATAPTEVDPEIRAELHVYLVDCPGARARTSIPAVGPHRRWNSEARSDGE